MCCGTHTRCWCCCQDLLYGVNSVRGKDKIEDQFCACLSVGGVDGYG